jgi:hypothetical protein
MKWFNLFLALAILPGACNRFAKKQQDLTVENEPTGSIMGKYAADTLIPAAFKQVYANPHLLIDTGIIASIPDSLFSRDKERHRFYFILVDKVMDVSDGAYSEPLYLTVNKYAQTYPKEMLGYLNTDYMLSDNSYSKWASGVLSEIGIECEGQEKYCIGEFQKNMKRNCTDCSASDLNEIDRFINEMNFQLSQWPTADSTQEN